MAFRRLQSLAFLLFVIKQKASGAGSCAILENGSEDGVEGLLREWVNAIFNKNPPALQWFYWWVVRAQCSF